MESAKIIPYEVANSEIESRGSGRSLDLDAVYKVIETSSETTPTHPTPPGLSTEAIIGIAVGCVCALLLAIVTIYACIRRSAQRKKAKQFEPRTEPPRLIVEMGGSGEGRVGNGAPGSARQQSPRRGDDASEYGSIRGTPPDSPTLSWKSAASRNDLDSGLDRLRPGSFETCYSLSSSYGSARSYASRKSRATLASFKSALED